MTIDKAQISQLRDKTNLVDLVQRHCSGGRPHEDDPDRYWFVCMFCEKRGLNVNERSRLYHCVYCKASGDALRFIETVYGCTFTEACFALAVHLGLSRPLS